jgi:CheY-like chemotaxis protein
MDIAVNKNAPVTTVLEPKFWKICSPQKKQILLLEDDLSMRLILLRLLAGEDYSVSPATDTSEALAFAVTGKYDLLLLDLNKPDANGRKALRQIKATKPELPFVVLTAQPSRFLLSLAAGVGVLLAKPLDFVQLFETIRNLLAEPPLENLPGTPAQIRTPGHSSLLQDKAK